MWLACTEEVTTNLLKMQFICLKTERVNSKLLKMLLEQVTIPFLISNRTSVSFGAETAARCLIILKLVHE